MPYHHGHRWFQHAQCECCGIPSSGPVRHDPLHVPGRSELYVELFPDARQSGRQAWRNEEFRTYLFGVLGLALVTTVIVYGVSDSGLEQSFRDSLFMIISRDHHHRIRFCGLHGLDAVPDHPVLRVAVCRRFLGKHQRWR